MPNRTATIGLRAGLERKGFSGRAPVQTKHGSCSGRRGRCQNAFGALPRYRCARDRTHKCSWRALRWTVGSSRGRSCLRHNMKTHIQPHVDVLMRPNWIWCGLTHYGSTQWKRSSTSVVTTSWFTSLQICYIITVLICQNLDREGVLYRPLNGSFGSWGVSLLSKLRPECWIGLGSGDFGG